MYYGNIGGIGNVFNKSYVNPQKTDSLTSCNNNLDSVFNVARSNKNNMNIQNDITNVSLDNGISKKDTSPTVKDASLPKNPNPLDKNFTEKNTDLSNQRVKQNDGSTFVYNSNGYVDTALDVNGNVIRMIDRNEDGSVTGYYDFKYDENGNETRLIEYNADGSVNRYFDTEWNENGNQARSIERNADGSLNNYTDFKYNKNGDLIRKVTRDANGKKVT